jgi:hypothetical protein
MNNIIRHTILLTAITAMLLPSIYSNILQLQRSVVKFIAHEKLETGHLTMIRIPAPEIHWYEEGEELVYNKQLFDVESFIIQNDTLIAWGLTDIEETAIDDAVKKLMQNSGSDQVLKNIGLNILDFMGFQANRIIIVRSLLQPQRKIIHGYLLKHLPAIYSIIQTPPPDYHSC